MIIRPFSVAYVNVIGKDEKVYTHAVVYGVGEDGEIYTKTRKTDWKPFVALEVETA